MKTKIQQLLLIIILLLISFSHSNFAQGSTIATTFVLTNEGGLIDDLIAIGYGNSNLYETLLCLQDYSGGIISTEFLETLASCPAGSEIFTANLSNYAGINNPVCVNTDGTVGINGIFGKEYYGREGYETYPENIGDGSEIFTYATSSEYYIDAGSCSHVGGTVTYYKAFAIAWSMEPPTTFVLSNEAPGYLIDNLIVAGYGSSNLYETLVALVPTSGGIISEEFLETLASCPAGSDIFTAPLTNFSNPANNPIEINTDGTAHVVSIYGKDFFRKEGYATYPEPQNGFGRELFTYATSPEYYIDCGSSNTGGSNYKAFAIAWSLGNIEVSVDSISIGETTTFDITTVASWTAESDQTWLAVNPTSGTGNATITLIAEANTTPNERTAHVTISIAGIVVQTITVTQAGTPVGIEDEETTPNKFELLQNYPNPFNPSTTIKYSVASVETPYMASLRHVTLEIFDVLGREVAALVDEYLPVGSYTKEWNAGNLPSGIYICRMEAGSYKSNIKLLLLK
ncbi:MAG: BACON domain-containing carbohydrate-binding protein [bacterium]